MADTGSERVVGVVPVSGHTHKHVDENGNEYEHSHEEVFTEDYMKAVAAYRKTFPTKQDVLDNVPDPAVKEMMLRMEQLGYDTAFDRFDKQQPQCSFAAVSVTWVHAVSHRNLRKVSVVQMQT